MGMGTKITVTKKKPWPPIEKVIPWYKRYAPLLAIRGAITAVIAYFSLRKRGKK